jgi:hypothetical protein
MHFRLQMTVLLNQPLLRNSPDDGEAIGYVIVNAGLRRCWYRRRWKREAKSFVIDR